MTKTSMTTTTKKSTNEDDEDDDNDSEDKGRRGNGDRHDGGLHALLSVSVVPWRGWVVVLAAGFPRASKTF